MSLSDIYALLSIAWIVSGRITMDDQAWKLGWIGMIVVTLIKGVESIPLLLSILPL